MKVYVVTYGCYSDRYVSAVFSTQEEADKYAARDDDGDVEEFEVDSRKGAGKFELFTVVIDQAGNETSGSYGPCEELVITPNYSFAHPSGRWFTGKSPDRDKALKLAAEARQAWLRETQAGQKVTS